MAATYRRALNHILREQSQCLAGARVAYWYVGAKAVTPEVDPLAHLTEGFPTADEDKQASQDTATSTDDSLATVGQRMAQRQALTSAAELLDAIRSGKQPDLAQARFCALTLSGNKSRVVVRDWMEGSFEALIAAIVTWFNDMSVVLPQSDRLALPPRFMEVLTACLRERPPKQDYKDWVKPTIPHQQELWRAALGGGYVMIPRRLVKETVISHAATLFSHRFIFSAIDSEHIKTESKYPLSRLVARMSLLRAYCVRYARITNQGDYAVDCALNPNHPRVAYHVGRLMAALEMIQKRAQGEIGATIAQTHYAAAATRPIAALPRIETLVQHHLPKIEPSRLREQYRLLLVEIKHRIRDAIPRTFDLEDQCLFHLGYYHQRAYQPYDEPPRRHMTVRGERVRSKSEVVVANVLAMLGIEYEYEAPLCFRNGTLIPMDQSANADVSTIRPDFTVRTTRDGVPVFIEHLGMMDNYSYRTDWQEREKLYASLGIRPVDHGGGPNGNLIMTEESNGTIDCQTLVKKFEIIH